MYVLEWAPCLKIFTSHFNTFQRAHTIEETLNNQVEKLGWPVDVRQYCHQPPLNWHDGSMNRVATTKYMKTMHGLPLTNASECLILSNRSWKHTFSVALFLRDWLATLWQDSIRPLWISSLLCICLKRTMALFLFLFANLRWMPFTGKL